jgi:hypothetical protein
MSNPENLHSNENDVEVELTMLRSDLAEFFQTHADMMAIHQPDDWDHPAEVVIAGIRHYDDNDGQPQQSHIHIRQRLDQNGTDYLIIAGKTDEKHWVQIMDNKAVTIYQGETPLGLNAATWLRRYLRPDVTDWDAADTQRCAGMENLYAAADSYARRNL